MAYDYSQAGYSPETVKYLDDLVAQRQALSDKYGEGIALNNPDYMYSRYVQDVGGADEGYKVYTPEEDIRRIMASGQGASEIFDPGYNVQSWGGSRNPNQFDFVRLGAGKTYTYTDNNTGQTYTASTPEQVQALTQLAKSQSGVGNNSASWSIKDSSGKEMASDTSYTPSFLKQAGQTISDLAVEYGIPMLLTAGVVNPALLAAANIPATSALATALGTGLSAGTQAAVAGGGAALGKLLKTGDLEKSLLSGAMAATGSYGLNVSGLGNAIGSAANDALGSVGIDLPPELFGYSEYGYAMPPTEGVENFLTGVTKGGMYYPGAGALSGVIPAQLTTPNTGASPQENVTVSAKRTPVTSGVLPNIVAPVAANALTNLGGYDVPATQRPVEEVKVGGKRTPDTDEYGAPFSSIAGGLAPSIGEQWLTSQAAKNAAEPIVGEPVEEPSDFDKYLRYASLGMTGLSLLGGLVGGGAGAKGGAGTIPQGFSTQLPSTFSAKLPTGSAIPAFGGGVTPESRMGRTATDLGDIDYTRYGFGPERSFFANVPQRAAKGGPMAVQNISDGRSDDIPAVLSDGEYVIDAETVALLGNGSNKAGAKQLDRFRANIRKHKGKELAKGRFSVNAKKPQAYLAGGRT